MKRCPQCDRSLPESALGLDNRRPDKLHSWCKGCKNRKQRERYASDPEHRAVKAEYRKKRLEDPEKHARQLKLQRAWRAQRMLDPKYIVSERQHRSWANMTPAQRRRKVETNRAWRAANREHVNRQHREYVKHRYHNDRGFRQNIRDWFTRRRNTERANGGSYTAEEWATMCLLVGGRCVACGQIAQLEVDHVVHVTAGGENDIENVQPLCRSCNASKGTRVADYRPLTLMGSMGLTL